MKTYQSTTESQWFELKAVQLTEEQSLLLRSKKEEDRAAISALLAQIKSQKESPVSTNIATKLNEFYGSIKPELKEDDVYDLISVDLTENESKKTGILNCRVNGEHKQIRF